MRPFHGRLRSLASLALGSALLAVAGPGPLLAQDPTTCPAGTIAVADGCLATSDVRDEIAAIVEGAMEDDLLKAAIVGLASEGERVMASAWGESMTGVPATPDMHFRNGAIAIAYMGTVLLQLQEQGVLSLDDTLATWLPDLPKADQITLRMLMNGTSGYADYVDLDLLPLYTDPFRHWEPEELIELALAQPMACEPGECWSYAHTNFVILGRVMEAATGRPLADLIAEGVLAPLALAGTRSEQTALIPEPVLHAFTAERGSYEESTYWDPSWTLAEGAVMTTTIADALASAEAFGEGTLLAPESHAEMLSPATAGFAPWDEKRWYGLGIFVIDGWVLQNPSFAGYAATIAYLPSRRLAIAVTTTSAPGASMDGNLSSSLLAEIAAYLAPESPLGIGGA